MFNLFIRCDVVFAIFGEISVNLFLPANQPHEDKLYHIEFHTPDQVKLLQKKELMDLDQEAQKAIVRNILKKACIYVKISPTLLPYILSFSPNIQIPNNQDLVGCKVCIDGEQIMYKQLCNLLNLHIISEIAPKKTKSDYIKSLSNQSVIFSNKLTFANFKPYESIFAQNNIKIINIEAEKLIECLTILKKLFDFKNTKSITQQNFDNLNQGIVIQDNQKDLDGFIALYEKYSNCKNLMQIVHNQKDLFLSLIFSLGIMIIFNTEGFLEKKDDDYFQPMRLKSIRIGVICDILQKRQLNKKIISLPIRNRFQILFSILMTKIGLELRIDIQYIINYIILYFKIKDLISQPVQKDEKNPTSGWGNLKEQIGNILSNIFNLLGMFAAIKPGIIVKLYIFEIVLSFDPVNLSFSIHIRYVFTLGRERISEPVISQNTHLEHDQMFNRT